MRERSSFTNWLGRLVPDPRSKRSLWAVAVSTLLMALALAGAHPAALLVTGFCFAASALVLWASADSAPVPAPAVLAFGLAAYCLLQALPLPIQLLRLTDPNAADVWARALHPFGETVSWGSISLDPGASVRESFKWCLYGLAFVSASIVTARYGRHVSALLVFLPALCVALVTLGHGIAGAESVFGVYEPRFGGSRWQYGPFVNPNNLSGYLNLGGFTGLGLVVSDGLSRYRGLIATGAAVMFGVSVLSGSRGGVWMLPLGLAAFLTLVYFGARSRSPRTRVSLIRGKIVLLATVGAGLVFAAAGATQTTWTQLLNDNVEKLQVANWALPLVWDFPVFGVGRGAFESVFPAYATPLRNAVYSHPENFVVQWITEWGILVGGGALLAYAWILRPRRSTFYGSRLGSGIAVGVGLVLLQNLVDLGLEIPALALSVSLALGTLWEASPRKDRLGRFSISAPARAHFVRAKITLGVAALWMLLCTNLGRQVSLERESLAEAARELPKNPAARSAWFARLRDAMLRHPADPYFARLGGAVALEGGDRDPMPWVQRALERGENTARSHLLAAQVVQRRGATAQAIFELRRAAELDSLLAQRVGRLAVAWSRDVDQVLAAAPRSTIGALVLTAAVDAWKDIGSLERQRLLEAAVARDRASVPARLGLGRLLLDRVEQNTCKAVDCATRALEQARAVLEAQVSRGGIELESDALALLERWAEADAAFVSRCPLLPAAELAPCWHARLHMLREKPGTTSAEIADVARQAADAACASQANCSEWLRELGDVLREQMDYGGALNQYERAALQSPSVTLMLRIAEAATRLGLLARADAALGRAAQLAGGDTRQLKEIADKRDTLRRQMLKRHGAP